MKLGVFAKTYVRPSLGEILAAARAQGFECVQFNFSCCGLPTLPASIPGALAQRIRGQLQECSLSMAAVSGTCNLIHPDAARREADLANLQSLVRACGQLGTGVVTLCTGTRDPVDMWRRHPDNDSAAAWRELVSSLERLLPVAQECRVVLGVEPEPANVVASAPTARKLLDEMKSPWLRIVFDAANLLQPHPAPAHERILREAAGLLGPEIVLAHAKDLAPGPPVRPVPAGRGIVDYGLYLSLLEQAGFDGPLVLHSLGEAEVPPAIAHLQRQLATLQKRSPAPSHALSQPR